MHKNDTFFIILDIIHLSMSVFNFNDFLSKIFSVTIDGPWNQG